MQIENRIYYREYAHEFDKDEFQEVPEHEIIAYKQLIMKDIIGQQAIAFIYFNYLDYDVQNIILSQASGFQKYS